MIDKKLMQNIPWFLAGAKTMELREWLFRTRMQQQQLAEKLGITRQQLSKIVNKKHYPRRDLAKKIVEATNGEVSYNDIYSPPEENGGTKS